MLLSMQLTNENIFYGKKNSHIKNYKIFLLYFV